MTKSGLGLHETEREGIESGHDMKFEVTVAGCSVLTYDHKYKVVLIHCCREVNY